jgi:hypothetical protein
MKDISEKQEPNKSQKWEVRDKNNSHKQEVRTK